MRTNLRMDDFTPWQINQDPMFAQSMRPESSKTKQLRQQKSQLVTSKQKIQQKKPITKIRLTSIKQLLRIKTQKNDQISPIKTLRAKKQKSLIRQLKPMNRNLINIIHNQQENSFKVNPQTQNKTFRVKKSFKQQSRFQRIHRNQSSQTSRNYKSETSLDFKKLKQSLFEKRNPSLQILLKVRQQLQKIKESRQQPILRTYSVHNIRLNTFSQKIKTFENQIKQNESNKLGDPNSNIKPIKIIEANQRQQVQPRLKSSINLRRNDHIIDRLYDKFY